MWIDTLPGAPEFRELHPPLDPCQFIELCERACSKSGSELERQLITV
jgi:hypothetical protein